MTSHTQIIIAIIVSTAFLGGITNFLLLYNTDNKAESWWIDFLKSFFLSLCASITVPLFLQIISNNLLDIPNDNLYSDKNYFILAGFCVIASFYSKRFLDDLYSKVNKAEMKAEEAKQIAENAEQKNQEIDNIDEIIDMSKSTKAITSNYSEIEIRKVVRAILASKYSYRTISGIARETELHSDMVAGILELLRNAGFSQSRKNKKGNDIWKIIYKD